MSPENRTFVKSTWAMVVPIADVAATLFYQRLFVLDPSLRPMFERTDMTQQRRKLMAALAGVVNGLDNLDPLIPVLENLGRNHLRYGVTDRHYDTVGAALLWTLEQGLKDAWVPAVKTAWTTAYGVVAGVMRNAAATSHAPALA
jgi:hemoglobin-like flavoprotein